VKDIHVRKQKKRQEVIERAPFQRQSRNTEKKKVLKKGRANKKWDIQKKKAKSGLWRVDACVSTCKNHKQSLKDMKQNMLTLKKTIRFATSFLHSLAHSYPSCTSTHINTYTRINACGSSQALFLKKRKGTKKKKTRIAREMNTGDVTTLTRAITTDSPLHQFDGNCGGSTVLFRLLFLSTTRSLRDLSFCMCVRLFGLCVCVCVCSNGQ
jgi:hypothetical protein